MRRLPPPPFLRGRLPDLFVTPRVAKAFHIRRPQNPAWTLRVGHPRDHGLMELGLDVRVLSPVLFLILVVVAVATPATTTRGLSS
jgi:hypothetical protein